MSPIIGLAISLVPQLLQLIKTDDTGTIERKVSEAVTSAAKTKSPDEAAKTVYQDPRVKADLEAKLAQIAVQAQESKYADLERQRQAELKELELRNADASEARRTLLGLSDNNPFLKLTPAIISYIVVIGFILLITLMILGKANIPDPDAKHTNVTYVVNILIGTLATAFATVINFWLGSSLGSRRKDAVIEYQAQYPRAPVAVDETPQPADDGAPETVAEKPDHSETSSRVLQPPASPKPGVLAQIMPELTKRHRHFPDGVSWELTADGVAIDGAEPKGSGGKPTTVGGIWDRYGADCIAAAKKYGTPIELIVATIATESGGDPNARRQETHDVSIGLMQTLVGTAREALGRPGLKAEDLFSPAVSIEAGTAYIARQSAQTHFDPPLAAAAYNAGSIREDGSRNRWRLYCYPPGTGQHVDRFVMWFCDAMQLSAAGDWGKGNSIPSFASEFSGAIAPGAPVTTTTAPGYPPRPAFRPILGTPQRQKLFGKFDYVAEPQPQNREHVRILGDWERQNIVEIALPLKDSQGKAKTARVHERCRRQFEDLWGEWDRRNLLGLILTFDGAFAPRFIRGSTSVLSPHAFGSAFDINAEYNPLGRPPAGRGEKGSVMELAPIANRFGFFWGGHFEHRLDGMHFEVAELQ